MKRTAVAGIIAMTLLLTSCAQLGLSAIVQPPRFTTASGRSAEIRLPMILYPGRLRFWKASGEALVCPA